MPTMNEMVDDFLAQKRIGVAGVSRGGQSRSQRHLQEVKTRGASGVCHQPECGHA